MSRKLSVELEYRSNYRNILAEIKAMESEISKGLSAGMDMSPQIAQLQKLAQQQAQLKQEIHGAANAQVQSLERQTAALAKARAKFVEESRRALRNAQGDAGNVFRQNTQQRIDTMRAGGDRRSITQLRVQAEREQLHDIFGVDKMIPEQRRAQQAMRDMFNEALDGAAKTRKGLATVTTSFREVQASVRTANSDLHELDSTLTKVSRSMQQTDTFIDRVSSSLSRMNDVMEGTTTKSATAAGKSLRDLVTQTERSMNAMVKAAQRGKAVSMSAFDGLADAAKQELARVETAFKMHNANLNSAQRNHLVKQIERARSVVAGFDDKRDSISNQLGVNDFQTWRQDMQQSTHMQLRNAQSAFAVAGNQRQEGKYSDIDFKQLRAQIDALTDLQDRLNDEHIQGLVQGDYNRSGAAQILARQVQGELDRHQKSFVDIRQRAVRTQQALDPYSATEIRHLASGDLLRDVDGLTQFRQGIQYQHNRGGLIGNDNMNEYTARVAQVQASIANAQSVMASGDLNDAQMADLQKSLKEAENLVADHAERVARIREKEASNASKIESQHHAESVARFKESTEEYRRQEQIKYLTLLKRLKDGEINLKKMSLAEVSDLQDQLKAGYHILQPMYQGRIGGGTDAEKADRLRFLQDSLTHFNYGNQGEILEDVLHAQRAANNRAVEARQQTPLARLRGVLGFGGRAYGNGRINAMNHLNHTITNVSQMGGMSLYGMGAVGLITGITKGTVGLSSQAESMKNTLAGLVNNYGQFVNLQGQAVSNQENFNRSLDYSNKVYAQIRDRAVKSILTTQEMFDYYLSGGPQLFSKGFNSEQTLDTVDKIASIGKAMGLSSSAVQSDIRDLATGQVTVRSQVLRTIGFTSEGLRDASAKGPDELKGYIDKMFAGFMPALDRIQNTTQSKLSRLVDTMQQMGIKIGDEVIPELLPALDELSSEMGDFVNSGRAREFGRSLGQMTKETIMAFTSLAEGLRPLTTDIKSLLLVGFLGTMSAFVAKAAIMQLAMANPIAALLVSLGALVTGIIYYNQQASEQRDKDIAERTKDINNRFGKIDNTKADNMDRQLNTLNFIARGGYGAIKNQTGTELAVNELRQLTAAYDEIKRLQDMSPSAPDYNSTISGFKDRMAALGINREGELGGIFEKDLGDYQGEISERIKSLTERLNTIGNASLDTANKLKIFNDIVAELRNEISNFDQLPEAERARLIQGRASQKAQALDRSINPKMRQQEQEQEERRIKLVQLQAAQIDNVIGRMKQRLTGLSDSDPSRAVVYGQMQTLEIRKARAQYDVNRANIEANMDKTLEQKSTEIALMDQQLANQIQEVRFAFEEQVRALRESILAQKDQLALTKERTSMLRQELALESKKSSFDRLQLFDPAQYKRAVYMTGEIYNDQLRLSRGQTNLAVSDAEANIRAANRKADPFSEVIGFFGDLKRTGFPDVKIDMASAKYLGDTVLNSTQPVNVAASNMVNAAAKIDQAADKMVQAAQVTAGAVPSTNTSTVGVPAGALYPRGTVNTGPYQLFGSNVGVFKGIKIPIGTPYKWGGNEPGKGLDCSGLTCNLYKQVGINLPRTAAQQMAASKPVKIGMGANGSVDASSLQTGDLIFMDTGQKSTVGHVGMYMGDGTVVHASSKKGTIVVPLDKFVKNGKLLGAGRYAGPVTAAQTPIDDPNATYSVAARRSANEFEILNLREQQRQAKIQGAAEKERARNEVYDNMRRVSELRVNQATERAQFKFGLRANLFGATPEQKLFLEKQNEMALQAYDVEQRYRNRLELIQSKMAKEMGDASIAVADARSSGRLRKMNPAQAQELLSRPFAIQQKYLKIATDETAGYVRVKEKEAKMQGELARLTEETNKLSAKRISQLQHEQEQMVSLAGLTGDDLVMAQLRAQGGDARFRASRIFSDAQERYTKGLTLVDNIQAAGIVDKATADKYRAGMEAEFKKGVASSASALIEAQNYDSQAAMMKTGIDLLNDSAQKASENLIRLSEIDLEKVFDKTFGALGANLTSLNESAQIAFNQKRSRMDMQVTNFATEEQRKAYNKALYDASIIDPTTGELLYTDYRMAESLYQQAQPGITQRVAEFKNGQIQGLIKDLKNMTPRIRRNERDQMFMNAGSSLALGIPGLLRGDTSVLNTAFGPMTDNYGNYKSRNAQFAIAAMSKRITPEAAEAMGYRYVVDDADATKTGYYRIGANGQLLGKVSQARMAQTAIGNYALGMAGEIGGNMLGTAMFPDKDPGAINMGTTIGGGIGMAVGGPWGGFAGSMIGGFVGGLLGGKKKDPEEERRRQLQKQFQDRILGLMNEFNKLLRPQSDYFRAIRGDVLYGSSTRWFSGRAYSAIGMQGAVGGR